MESMRQLVQTWIGINLSEGQEEAFTIYERELLEWNARFNLTAIRSPEEVRVKHFLDSLTCLPVLHAHGVRSLVDVGTGAGFPGLPLKIVLPELRLTLVESVGKKLNFCRHMVETLGLEGVALETARAEELGQCPEHREQYDAAVARAVAAMPALAEYLLPLARVGGIAVAQKGENAAQEATGAQKAIETLGGQLAECSEVRLPGVSEARYLVVVNKVRRTPRSYPRRPGLPSRQPL